MSENVEDLYLKGFMAYSSKDFNAARAYYERVLAIDPSHQKAREGLEQLATSSDGSAASAPTGGGQQARKKKSSKEVLQEIKQLYAQKKFSEASSLCEKLLARHPNNADLQGLFRKIENRRKQQEGASVQANTGSGKTTQQFASAAEESVPAEETGASAADIEKLIQRGVSLYEIQDYENAIAAWKEVLALDPDNRIARDYISNVEPLLDGPAAEPQPAPPAPVADDSAKPGKDEMVRIYNEAMGLYKEERYQEAIEKWNHILKFHPNHKETLHCLEKAQAAMSEGSKHHDLLEEARDELSHGRHLEAEKILARLSAEAPDLEGLDALKTALAERQRQISDIRSLEIETDEEVEDDTTATDDEITRYFTPDTKDTSPEARQVSRVAKPKAEKKGSKMMLIIAVAAIVVFLGGGFFGFRFYQQKTAMKTETPVFSFLVREVAWHSAQQKAEDFLNFGNDFRDEGQFLLAAYAYSRVDDIIQPRMQTLKATGPNAPTFEVDDEVSRLEEILEQARTEHDAAVARITAVEVEANSMDLVDAEVRRGRLQEACDRMMDMLSNDMDNTAVREKLGDTMEDMALELVAENQLEDARLLFGRVATLKGAYEIPRRHEEVIQRYFHSKITPDDKDQWFFFFTN